MATEHFRHDTSKISTLPHKIQGWFLVILSDSPPPLKQVHRNLLLLLPLTQFILAYSSILLNNLLINVEYGGVCLVDKTQKQESFNFKCM